MCRCQHVLRGLQTPQRLTNTHTAHACARNTHAGPDILIHIPIRLYPIPQPRPPTPRYNEDRINSVVDETQALYQEVQRTIEVCWKGSRRGKLAGWLTGM